MIYYYVYRLFHLETGEFYIGSRKSKNNPEMDYMYKGSMQVWDPDKNKLIKEIIKEGFATLSETIEFEANEIRKVIDDPLNRNYHIPPHTFHTEGKSCSGNDNGFFRKKHTDEFKKHISNLNKGENNKCFGRKWIHKDEKQLFK